MAASVDPKPSGLETALTNDPNLTKSTCFSIIEEVLQKNVVLKHEQLHSFVEILNRNLLRQDNTVRILKIYMNILAKHEAGVYPQFPLFEETITCIFTVLNKVLKKNNWDDVELKDISYNALKLLLDIPDNIFKTVNVQISDAVLVLVKSYLESSSIELPSHNKVFLLLKKLLKSFTDDKKRDFVGSGIHIWLTPLMSFVFRKENVYREFGIIIAEEIIPILTKIEYFSNPQWALVYKLFLDSKKYPEILITLLKNDDTHWHRLWIIIIQMSGTELHKIGGSINPLLFVLQEGFKKSVEIKCQAFQCLRVLINNFALNEKVLYNTSRIKVLSIALESNNAKTEPVSVLKFEIWWHLIKLLQPKIKLTSSMILLPFLRYCFSDPKKNLDGKRSRTYPGELFPSVQKLAIKSFVEICGHSNCDNCVGSEFIKLPGSILDPELLEQSYAYWIYSLKQMTIYSRTHLLLNGTKSEFDMLIKNLKCVWKSFIRAASKINNPENFTIVFEHLLKLLTLFVEEYSSDALFAEIILMLIIPAIVDKDYGYSTNALKNDNMKISNGENAINSLINIILLPKLYHVETMLSMNFNFKYIIDIGLLNANKEFSEWLLGKLTPDNHGPLLWCHLADGLTNTTSQITTATLLSVLLWPINKYNGNIKLSEITTSWKNLLRISKSKIRTGKSKSSYEDDLFSAIDNCKNDLLALYLLPELIQKQAEDRPADIAYFNPHLKSFEKYLNKINICNMDNLQATALCNSLHFFASLLESCHIYSISTNTAEMLLTTTNNNLKVLICFFNTEFDEFIKLRLDSASFVNSILKTLTKLNLSEYSTKLITNVNGLLWILMRNVKDINIDAKYTQMLEEKSFDKSELVKIQQMLKLNKKTKKDMSDVSKNSFEKPSITKVTKKGKSKKNDAEEFVVIKPTWKFDPKKLTEHQKDVLKRRRDDIPALYEDLSQSQEGDTMNSWRPPGYKSDSQGDSSMSQDITINTFINKLKPKSESSSESKPKTKSPFTTLKKIQCKPVDVDNDADKTGLRKSITKTTDNNESISMLSPRVHISVMKESNIIATPPAKDRLDQTPKNSPDVNKKNLENCEFVASPTLTNSAKKKKSLLARLNESIKTLKGSLDTDDSPKDDNSDIIPIIDSFNVAEAPTVIVEDNIVPDVKIDNTPLTPNRPIRVKRKPNKFLAEETLSAKKQRETRSSDEDKSSQNSTDSNDSETVPKKKRNRLMSQLQIDTIEGHPLINSDKPRNSLTTRNTRRSLCKPNESQSTVVNPKIDISSAETESCIVPEEIKIEEKSIFSQETECFVTEKIPTVEKECVVEPFDFNKCNQSESFDCSPDFIASSQESESVTSLTLVVSKSRDTSYTSEDNPLKCVVSEPDPIPIVNNSNSVIYTTQEIAEMNTEHIDILDVPEPYSEEVEIIDEDTQLNTSPSKMNISIVSSPCKDDINERNIEFMNSTMDLSPIKIVSLSYENSPVRIDASPEKADDNIANTPKENSVAQISTSATSPDLFCNEKVSPVKLIEKTNENSPPKITSSENIWATMKFPKNNRSAQLIELCMIDNEKYQQEKKDYQENKKDNSPVKSTTNKITFVNTVDDDEPLLEFNKTVPCFTASPAGPILKRKFEPDGLTLSPSSKKKRVSFHDPPVSTEMSVKRYIIPKGDPRSPQVIKMTGRSDLGSPKPRMMVAKCLMTKIKHIEKSADVESDMLSDNDEAGIEALPEPEKSEISELEKSEISEIHEIESEKPSETEQMDVCEEITPLDTGIESDVVHLVTDSQISALCSLTVEMQQPLEIVTNHMLDDKDPIYPSLVDCRVSISEISSDLSSPLWNQDFLKEIVGTITTIGDLAKMTELEINRLPFKSPKIDTVKRTLINYEEKMKKYNSSAIKITDSFFDATFSVTENKIEIPIKTDDCVVDNVEDNPEMELIEEIIVLNTETISESTNPDESIIESTDDQISVLENLLESRTDDVMKMVSEKLPHSVILDSVPTASLLKYISDKMCDDTEFSDEIKSRCNVSNKNCDDIIKSLRSQLSLDIENVLTSFDKLVNS